MIDVVHEINATRREVGTRTLEAGEAHLISITRVYDGALEDLWDAVTNPERIPRWFAPVHGDLRAGGRYQVEGNASGTIERCEPPTSFAATWEFGGAVSWIEVTLAAEAPERTKLRLEHVARVDDERLAQFGPGAVGVGWELGLLGLGMHLRGGGASAREEGEAWAVSPEGARFMTLSSDAWFDAAVAGGGDPAAARAAADRTTAFYTGAEIPG